MTSTRTLDAAAALAAVRRRRAEADEAQVRLLEDVIAWCGVHEVTDLSDAATWGDTPVLLAGEGAPQVSEFCVYDLAAALHLTTDSARSLVGEAIEIAHRLPRIRQRVRAGSVQVWRARRVAAKTIALSPEAADYVDEQVARFAPRISTAQLDRLVDEAVARFMPAAALELAERSAEQRFVQVDHEQVSFMGTSAVRGELDLADAVALEKALQAGAQALADLGSRDSLDVRRSIALGQLARGDRPLDLESAARPSRQVILYVHLSRAALGAGGIGRVESPDTLVTAEQIAAWCGAPQSRVVVRPVIDLDERIAVTSYLIPDRIREHVSLRDRHCVFPYCTRRSRTGDIDHIVPFDEGGLTSTTNLAALCRSHHRLKTFGHWTYSMVEPGCYLWRSPHGYRYLKDGTGTRDLTPRPVDPPGG